MRHVPPSDQLEAMKAALRDLESLKLLSPSDLEILDSRRRLQEEIAALEQQQKASDGHGAAA